mmetsp:Transcript_22809/g.64823  ORF Transcript_22809/g.64823 Transcript_22809/m.64823 type:complete len:235 (+) Transcript_22809:1056-1760(+)
MIQQSSAVLCLATSSIVNLGSALPPRSGSSGVCRGARALTPRSSRYTRRGSSFTGRTGPSTWEKPSSPTMDTANPAKPPMTADRGSSPDERLCTAYVVASHAEHSRADRMGCFCQLPTVLTMRSCTMSPARLPGEQRSRTWLMTTRHTLAAMGSRRAIPRPSAGADVRTPTAAARATAKTASSRASRASRRPGWPPALRPHRQALAVKMFSWSPTITTAKPQRAPRGADTQTSP